MKAVRMTGVGRPLEIQEIPIPQVGNGDILVRVRAAAVNPADVKVVTGELGAGFIHAMKFPMAFGYDFSGVVQTCSPSKLYA